MAETKETPKFDGISAQINLSPGSETHRRFAELMRETGAMTARSFVEMLMDRYQSPHTDNSEAIADLEQQLKKALAEKDEWNNTAHNREIEISELKSENEDLKDRLEEANKTANANAEKGLGQQLQLNEIKERIEGAVIVRPNPVSRFFLDEMAEKTKTEQGKILEKLFFDDLQNPRANNLPYTVTAARIFEVMETLKKQQSNA